MKDPGTGIRKPDLEEVRQAVAAVTGEVIQMRRDFHAHPELGFEEHRTAGIVEDYLGRLGISTTRMAGTGVTGMIEGARPGPVLMLRADMDALPVQEENDVPYRSLNDGIMHACGHDAHTAMLLGAARVLTGMKERLSGSIKLVFQPNEEIAGACKMIEEGVLENPKVDGAMAIHIWTPLPSGTIGVSPGAVMAALDIFRIVLKGRGGHTGYPEAAVDPIVAAANIIQTTQTIQTREISLRKPTVIMFGRIEGGVKGNIIPDQVVLEGTMRYLYQGGPGSEENPAERLERIVKGVCEAHRVEFELSVERENNAVINDPDMARLARAAAEELLGSAEKVVDHASMAGEDFSEYASRVPGVFYYIGTGNPGAGSDFPHHNPRFNIDESTLSLGVEMHVLGALRYFSDQRR